MDKILFVRRDNIGDLVCTTPAIHAVRENFPQARIGILANTYNAPLIENHPDIDDLYILEKPKHAPGKRKLAVLWNNLQVFREIRRQRYDVAIACGTFTATLARYTWFTGARRRLGYTRGPAGRLYYNVPLASSRERQHEVVRVYRLLAPLGLTGEPGGLFLPPDAAAARHFAEFLELNRSRPPKPLLGVAISCRLKANVWPLGNFISLIERVIAAGRAQVLLLWAPGSADHPAYPGDDAAAAAVLRHFQGAEAILPYPTPTLKDLAAALAGADAVVTLDTGSLHLAAAAKRPTIALMTANKALEWFPWKTESRILTAPGKVAEITVDKVWQATDELLAGLGAAPA